MSVSYRPSSRSVVTNNKCNVNVIHSMEISESKVQILIEGVHVQSQREGSRGVRAEEGKGTVSEIEVSLSAIISGTKVQGKNGITSETVQRREKKFFLGCVKSPPRPEAESRNLGQTVLVISVDPWARVSWHVSFVLDVSLRGKAQCDCEDGRKEGCRFDTGGENQGRCLLMIGSKCEKMIAGCLVHGTTPSFTYLNDNPVPVIGSGGIFMRRLHYRRITTGEIWMNEFWLWGRKCTDCLASMSRISELSDTVTSLMGSRQIVTQTDLCGHNIRQTLNSVTIVVWDQILLTLTWVPESCRGTTKS